MNPKSLLSKTTSVIATLLLAVGGSLIATQSASAVAPSFTLGTINDQGPTSGIFGITGIWNATDIYWVIDLASNPAPADANAVISHTGYTNYGTRSVTLASDFWTISNLTSNNYKIHVVLKNAATSETTLQSTASFTFPTPPPPANVITLNANGGVLGAVTSITQNGNGAPVSLPVVGANAPTKSGCTVAGWGLTQANADNATLIAPFWVPNSSRTVYASWNCLTPPQQQSTAQVTRTVERSIPTPVFQAPILNSIAPKLSTGFSSNGGRLVLKDVKPADITSVMLNGKKVEVVASKSGAALRIPAGAGAGDLKFTMADGTVIDVPNAVKITVSQVDPKLVDLNNLPTFKVGSVAVPSSIKAALAKNKEVILDSANAKCVGYATSNSAAARATALSRASNVCGIITDMNENIEPLIKVLVNKVVAKKSPVRYQTW